MSEETENQEQQEQSEQPKANDPTFTQEDVERVVKRRVRKLEEELAARPSPDDVKELQEKLAAIEEEKELAGKSAQEKALHKHQVEVAKLNKQIEQLTSELESKSKEAQAISEKLTQERLNRTFGDALQKAGVHSDASADALRVLLTEVRNAQIDEDTGKVTAEYGDLLEDAPEAIAKQFLEERSWYATAKAGGAGTRQPNGQVKRSGSVGEMSMEELAQQAALSDPSVRS